MDKCILWLFALCLLSGFVIAYTVPNNLNIVLELDNNYSIPNNLNIILDLSEEEGPSDSCTYSGSGNWNINLADNCVLNDGAVVNAAVTVFGDAGSLTINAIITADQISFTPDDFDGDSIISILTGGALSAAS